MSAQYAPVLWNRQKKIYDRFLFGLMALYLVIFIVLQAVLFPEITAETLLIRATGTLSFLMLHIILAIGPLSRLDKRFLPLLYNRRHFGVSMFVVALIHGILNLIQFHALGNEDILVSLFTSNMAYDSLVNFPFQTLGFFALMIFFLMAATSHDFWLKNLSPNIWKSLHMSVYIAYAMLVSHVMLGVVQLEKSFVWIGLIGSGMFIIIALHLMAAVKVKKEEDILESLDDQGFVELCSIHEIEEKRAKIFFSKGENIAVFKYDGKVSAVNNICRHQHGPLGEGKIVDGCITCPWHGYQYLPHNGQSPPPFTEKVETYDVKIVGKKVWVNPTAHAEGTEVQPAEISKT